MTPEEKLKKLRGLQSHLKEEIIGQEEVIEPIVNVLTRGELGLTNKNRPKGSFLFVGPSGVGKTEIVLTINRYLFGGGNLARFDMSEYQIHESVGLMIGRNLNEGGRLGTLFQSSSNWILLFDEVEKAHPLIMDLFLQVLDAGRLTLANETVLNFSNCYIVFTSNLGAREAMQMNHADSYTFQNSILKVVRQRFRPEFYARINEKLVFRKLETEDQLQIADTMIARTTVRMKTLGYTVELSPSARQKIINDGLDIQQGARPLRGICDNYIEGAIAKALIEGKFASGTLDARKGESGLILG